MLSPFAKRWHTGNSTAFYSMKPLEEKIVRLMVGCQTLLSKEIVSIV